MLKIVPQVAFYERGTDRVPFRMPSHEAEKKLTIGQLIVRSRDKRGRIVAVESSGISFSPQRLGARPGSFGIRRERIAPSDNGRTAGLVYSHHNPEIRKAA